LDLELQSALSQFFPGEVDLEYTEAHYFRPLRLLRHCQKVYHRLKKRCRLGLTQE
jgi:hypothetical protein